MQKKFMLLFGLMSLLAVGQAWAAPEAGHPIHAPNFSIGSADGKYKLGIGALLQENNKVTYVMGTPSKLDYGMNIDAARLSLHGNAFDPAFSYLFQAQLDKENSPSVKVPSPRLLDGYGDMAIHHRWAHVRIGKFSTPFSRQLLMSPALRQFGSLSAASQGFSGDGSNRDVGLMLHNGTHHEIEYALAVLNQGVAGRVGFNHGAIDGYNATDFTGGHLRYAVAASVFVDTKYETVKFEYLKTAFDFIAKYKGLATNGVFYFRRGLEGADKDKNTIAASIDLGYLINEMSEPVVRYSWSPAGDQSRHEITLGLNHYSFGNHLRAQIYAGAGLLDKFNDISGGVQFQLAI